MKTDGHAAGEAKGLPDPRIVFLTEELAPYLGEDIPPLLDQGPRFCWMMKGNSLMAARLLRGKW